MLSSIATSMITVAGVAFSITVVALSLASSQYSPRVLRQFMRYRANQWVLGVFVGVFAFCLTVLPRVRGGDENGFVPALAVVGAVGYALAGVGCLIFFIHHVATSIQASCIVADIAAETRAVAARLYPKTLTREMEDSEWAPPNERNWRPVLAVASGYLQLIEDDALLGIAAKHDVIVRMEHGVGDFIVAGTRLVSVSGRGADARELAAAVSRVFTISRTRTIEQDLMFGVQQIVDVALRALSPSLNDPTTATLCVDYLTTILAALAPRKMGTTQFRREGEVRVFGRGLSFKDVVATAFGDIRAAAPTQPLVLARILDGLNSLADITQDASRRAALRDETVAILDFIKKDVSGWRIPEIQVQAERLVEKLSRECS